MDATRNPFCAYSGTGDGWAGGGGQAGDEKETGECVSTKASCFLQTHQNLIRLAMIWAHFQFRERSLGARQDWGAVRRARQNAIRETRLDKHGLLSCRGSLHLQLASSAANISRHHATVVMSLVLCLIFLQSRASGTSAGGESQPSSETHTHTHKRVCACLNSSPPRLITAPVCLGCVS